MSVPEHLLITAARAKQSDFGGALQQVFALHCEAFELLIRPLGAAQYQCFHRGLGTAYCQKGLQLSQGTASGCS